MDHEQVIRSIINFMREKHITLFSILFHLGVNIIEPYDLGALEHFIPHDVIYRVINYGTYNTIVVDEALHEEHETVEKINIIKNSVTNKEKNIIYNMYLLKYDNVYVIDITVCIKNIGVMFVFNQKLHQFDMDYYMSLCEKIGEYATFGDSVVRLQFVD